MENLLALFTNYWATWTCGLIAGGLVFFGKHYIKLQREDAERRWKKSTTEICDNITKQLDKKIERNHSDFTSEDVRIHTEINTLNTSVDGLRVGILSIQGKQFKDFCRQLLKNDHKITLDEYEEFQETYDAYKALGGNHQGDILHDGVVEKFNKQL